MKISFSSALLSALLLDHFFTFAQYLSNLRAQDCIKQLNTFFQKYFALSINAATQYEFEYHNRRN